MNQLPPIRSLLFAPGSDERKLKRALESIADAVVADLEDAVTPDNKSRARMLVVEVFGAARDGGPARFVRVNAMQSAHGDDDLAALAALDLDGIIVPKATPEAIAWLGEGETPVIAVIETAAGLRAAFETASCPRVQALQLGGADLGAELGLTPRADGQEILFARSQLVVDSAAAGIRAPIDVVHLDVHNAEALERECVLARNSACAARRAFTLRSSRSSTGRSCRPTRRCLGRGDHRRLRRCQRGRPRRAPRPWRARRPSARDAGADHHRRGPRRECVSEPEQAPKEWRGRFYEDIDVGDFFRSRLGRTITETDNVWFTCLTLNTNQSHFNNVFAEKTRFGQPLVNSTLTLAIITGLSVPDTSENATANLAWTDITMPNPVFVGDTLWAETEILEMRESKSNPHVGIISMRCRGINQRREVVIEFRRTFMIYRRSAPEAQPLFPGTDTEWAV